MNIIITIQTGVVIVPLLMVIIKFVIVTVNFLRLISTSVLPPYLGSVFGT